MKEEDVDNLKKDLEKVTNKYGLINCSFCGNNEEQQFIGFIIGTPTIGNMWMSSLNVGRLWQHIRETVRKTLQRFEVGGHQGVDW
jgi:hypothetical protein